VPTSIPQSFPDGQAPRLNLALSVPRDTTPGPQTPAGAVCLRGPDHARQKSTTNRTSGDNPVDVVCHPHTPPCHPVSVATLSKLCPSRRGQTSSDAVATELGGNREHVAEPRGIDGPENPLRDRPESEVEFVVSPGTVGDDESSKARRVDEGHLLHIDHHGAPHASSEGLGHQGLGRQVHVPTREARTPRPCPRPRTRPTRPRRRNLVSMERSSARPSA